MVTEAQIRRELNEAAKKLNEAHNAAGMANARIMALISVLRSKGVLEAADVQKINSGRM